MVTPSLLASADAKKYHRQDLDKIHFKDTMKKITRFQYNWNIADDAIKKQDGLSDNKYSLANVLEEAVSSRKTNIKTAELLNHIIPCCRMDRGKRDYINSLLNRPGLSMHKISKIEEDIKFDSVQAPSTKAKLKEFS